MWNLLYVWWGSQVGRLGPEKVMFKPMWHKIGKEEHHSWHLDQKSKRRGGGEERSLKAIIYGEGWLTVHPAADWSNLETPKMLCTLDLEMFSWHDYGWAKVNHHPPDTPCRMDGWMDGWMDEWCVDKKTCFQFMNSCPIDNHNGG
jgi:hypothetical protein